MYVKKTRGENITLKWRCEAKFLEDRRLTFLIQVANLLNAMLLTYWGKGGSVGLCQCVSAT
jgi:hypothetical protein